MHSRNWRAMTGRRVTGTLKLIKGGEARYNLLMAPIDAKFQSTTLRAFHP